MATDKQPRNSAAKKTTKGATSVPTTSEPVSTAYEPGGGTERNAILEGNGATDLDEIRKRAYELYEQDGRLDGKHHDHWIQAESEVRNRRNKKSSGSRSDNKNQQRIA